MDIKVPHTRQQITATWNNSGCKNSIPLEEKKKELDLGNCHRSKKNMHIPRVVPAVVVLVFAVPSSTPVTVQPAFLG